VLPPPEVQRSIPTVQIDALLSALAEEGVATVNPEAQVAATRDQGDEYLVALA
jgi:hypothetical protein